MQTTLWRYNPITGYWIIVRHCLQETSAAWLATFRSDEPSAAFRLAKRQPKDKP